MGTSNQTPRSYTDHHLVGAADADADGIAHLSSIARWLQETAFADGLDAELAQSTFWIIRRLTLTVERMPVYGEPLTLKTWCSAAAKSVAERRTSLRGDRGAAIDAEAIWVHVDAGTRKPSRLPARFHEVYGPSLGERRPRMSLRHPADPPADAETLRWWFGKADIDLAGHVSNLWYWEIAEEYLDLSPLRGEDGPPHTVEAEFRAGSGAGEVQVHRKEGMLWVREADGTLAATLAIDP